ncbi:hypothetical protein P152DRAFT_263784 [Eremomyces bilateralis CBS 781.70]|uniref:BHLH domain-containing protein n=1 Tax=Eremomyces bilateralis CBS 781.70 TaxID=1392243 RepID=A0A6G1G880_9PEZI|nr:uncharacterized protein P152DRAFT_263784 [Eremomyces bilateralis CBS 781.70]KAF1814202.1 hypothetical protein P152DRAFT_263784 [Eremomyces bilateralis CBS 781.70]
MTFYTAEQMRGDQMATMTPAASLLPQTFFDTPLDTGWSGDVNFGKGMSSLNNPSMLVNNLQLDQQLPPETVDWVQYDAPSWNNSTPSDFPVDQNPGMISLEESDETPSSDILDRGISNPFQASIEVEPPRRKRGRPRKIRDEPAVPTLPRAARGRQPHTEVEKKYRNSLNQGMEQLRKALPHNPKEPERDSDCHCQVRLSKLGVLVAAADWLGRRTEEVAELEQQLEELGLMKEENTSLKEENTSLREENESMRSKLSTLSLD